MKQEQIVNEALTSPIYNLLKETPLTPARKLSEHLGCELLLKREDLHHIFSFKARGAYHKMLKMPATQHKNGLVAASAGNHAQGVAYGAQSLGLSSHIFMPSHTSTLKVEAVRSFGAHVSLKGNNFNETLKYALNYARTHNQVFFHPFDDYDVICGQATVGAELLREMPTQVEAIFVACGGGGLLAGITAVIKQLRPKIKVIGVEPEDAASMHAALKKGRLVTLPYVGTFAETVAVARVGTKTFRICKDAVDDVLVVDIGSVCNAIKEIYEDTRTIVEPAGALGVAGARAYVQSGQHKGGPLIAVVSGANMNFDALRYVIERTSSGEKEEMLLAAQIPEQPGSFLKLCSLLSQRHVSNVTEFNYRYTTTKNAHVFAGLAIANNQEREQILALLKKHGIIAMDLTGDETAQLHIRHMIGGRAHVNIDEQVYRFEFPEHREALMDFLRKLDKNWNISLFHYRFQGASVGRVLVGFQVPDSKRRALELVFKKIGYPFWAVTNNAAYDMFLANLDRET